MAKRDCSISGCERKHYIGGYCSAHFQRLKKHGKLNPDTPVARSVRHGMSKTPTYRSWVAMRRRCMVKESHQYHGYGARGITVCDEWADDFMAFFNYIGERPSNTTLDRIDVNGNYEPGNVRWASPTEQGRNKRNNNRITSANGETKCLSEWAELCNMRPETLQSRMLTFGMSLEEAMTRPSHANRGLPRRKVGGTDFYVSEFARENNLDIRFVSGWSAKGLSGKEILEKRKKTDNTANAPQIRRWLNGWNVHRQALANIANISITAAGYRMRSGWSTEKIIKTPQSIR